MISKAKPTCKPPWYECDVCDDEVFSSTPPEPGAKLYELHGCLAGIIKARDDNATCKHCGAPTASYYARCGCSEEIAQRKADDEAAEKKRKEDAARIKLHNARYEQERADKQRKEDELSNKQWKEMFEAGRKKVQRAKLAVELRDREQALKARELTRSERRYDNFDAEAADADEGDQVPGGKRSQPLNRPWTAPTWTLPRLPYCEEKTARRCSTMASSISASERLGAVNPGLPSTVSMRRSCAGGGPSIGTTRTPQAPSNSELRSWDLTWLSIGAKVNSSTCGPDWTALP